MKIQHKYFLREVSGTWVAVPAGSYVRENSAIVNLNETGADIFKLLQNGTTFEEVTETICQKYNVSADQAEKDVDEFLTDLKKKIEIV